MLIGQFSNRIDEKSRVSFPKRFRSVLGDELVATQGFENSLIVVSVDGWKSLLGNIEKKPFTTLQARETQRFLFGGAVLVELDDKGRFIIPDYLKRYAKINDEIIFVGLSRYVEIWDRTLWDEYQTHLTENIATIAERIQEGEKDE